MSYNNLVGQMRDSEWIIGNQYVCKVLDEDFLKLNHYYESESDSIFYDEAECEDYNHDEYKDNRVIIFNGDYDKVFVVTYLYSNEWPMFVVSQDDGFEEPYSTRYFSTWCIDILGDEESHPEYFI